MMQAAIDAVFARFGLSATYTRSGGHPVPIIVLPKRPDRIDDFGTTRFVSETAVFEVRVSELPDPAEGGEIAIDGDRFVIQGRPRREDPDRLIWTLEAHLVPPDGELVSGDDGFGLLTETDQELLGLP